MTTKQQETDSDMSQCATISVDDVIVGSGSQIENTAGSEFTDFEVPESDIPEVKVVIKKKKEPKRILHFSDGTLEEYSTDEDETDQPAKQEVIDPKTLAWPAWMWYYTALSAAKVLGVADTCGEKLAWFFGITSPKYQTAIDEYYRMKEEEEEDKRLEREEAAMEWSRTNHAMSLSQESIAPDSNTEKGPVQLDQPKDLPSLVAMEAKF